MTGGAGGIGSAITRAVAASGHRVALTYYRGEDRARALVEELRVSGAEVTALPLDLEDPDSVAGLLDRVHDRLGPVSVAVHNAVAWPENLIGGPEAGALLESGWRTALRGTVEGTLALTEAAVADMAAAGWGRVVLVSSAVVRLGMAGRVAYSASKSALHGAARSLAWQVGPQGVTVNVVVPGIIATERVLAATGGFGEAVRDVIAHTPLRRLATPEEVAATVGFLASDGAAGITGQEIVVDGGQT
ncbi:SDR family NAD(P)-dependent oxidoreductase [Gandjariella thermophila]|uniref:Beta-ketoacyl-ACP reductase n=1 Tax=Gandjariella thermophila TaxID=1931992 RepID=A0A4D4J4Z0_9PSEU|nr:SDR family oxidoreductase [Gandjariella thermophila]GDY31745.1 beta-ketoacyl-ACP reductase [Gandjariella thermophila]